MYRKGLIGAAALSLSILLASCGDPEGEANTEFVAISSDLTTASTQIDPVSKFEVLSALDKRLEALKEKHANTHVAVRLAADEKVGPYRPSELKSEIEVLSHSPAFCERNPDRTCILAFVSQQEGEFSEAIRIYAGGSRIALALREENPGKASSITKKLNSELRANPGQKFFPLENATRFLLADMTREDLSPDSPRLKAASAVLNGGDTRGMLKRAVSHGAATRLERKVDIDAARQLISIAKANPSIPNLMEIILSKASSFAVEGMDDAEVAKLLSIWPKENLPYLLGKSSSMPIWSFMDVSSREQAVTDWPDGTLTNIPSEAFVLLGKEYMVKAMEVRHNPADVAYLANVYLDRYGKEAPADEYISIVERTDPYNQTGWFLRGIVDRMVASRDAAVALASELVTRNDAEKEPAKAERYMARDTLWMHLAEASSPAEIVSLLSSAASMGVLPEDDLRLTTFIHRRPDLVPVDLWVDLSFAWGDAYYPKSDSAVKSYMGSMPVRLAGRYALKDIDDATIKKFAISYLEKPYADVSNVSSEPWYAELEKRGLKTVVEEIGKRAQSSGDFLAVRGYSAWEVESAIAKNDVRSARVAVAGIQHGLASQYLVTNIIQSLGNPTRRAVWDDVADNQPEIAVQAIEDIRGFEGKDSDPTALYKSLPRIYNNPSISAEGRIMGQIIYVEWLWAERDKTELGKLVFQPSALDPAIWYLAADALVGMYN